VKSWLTDKTVLVGTLLFSILLGVCVYNEFLLIALLPLVILMVWWGVKRLDLYIGFILLAVPLSINLQELEVTSVGLYMPTEPLLFGALIIFLFRFLSGWPVDKRLFTHPISITIGFMMIWMAITTLTSYDQLVSLKFMTSRAWFIVSFFFFLGHIMLLHPAFRERMIMLLLFPLCIVVIYTLIRHAEHDFSKHAGHWMMKPFFKDHTSYGAVLAMMLPPAIALLSKKERPILLKLLIAMAVGIISIGLILSFTRAAWVSVVGVGFLFIAMKIGVKLKSIVAIGVLALVVVFVNFDTLMIELQRNKQDSSDDLAQHVKSISNISSDDSNLERLNRWSCAVSLFQQRPITGWGPGTYQFVYAPLQKSEFNTVISTNNADGGNAHSEYLGPLAEQGAMGILLFLLLVWWASIVGFRLWNNLENKDERNLAVSIYLGLMTYFIHGVLNNYLDTDKASAPFWGFLALLVVLDIESRGKALPKATA
jgi:putative inorganic carbon (HCO3(-)) transporter